MTQQTVDESGARRCKTYRCAGNALAAVFLAVALLSCAQRPTPTTSRMVEMARAPTPATKQIPVATVTPSPVATARPPATTSATSAPTAVPTTPVPTSSPTPMLLEQSQIMLVVMLDYARHHLTVTETITYTNRTLEPLSELLLVAEPNRWPGAFRLNDLRWGGDRPVEGYRLEGARLWLPFPDLLAPERSASLTVSFEMDVPLRPGPFGYSDRQLNLGDWYLFPPPYRSGQGWLTHEPAGVGEYLVYDLYDFKVDLRLKESVTGLVIAASAPADVGDTWRHYRLAKARSFALSASTVYDCMRSSADGVNVEVCAFPEHHVAGTAALKATTGALLLYDRLFGSYPHASLTVVEARFPDGMEYEGLYFLGQEYFAAYDGTPHNYLTALAAHETAHQWWYGIVGNDQALEPWLDEAWATYSELLFYETQYPDSVAWWWDYRVNRHQPTGWVDSTIYDHRGFRSYVNAVYLRGAQFLQELRGALGDEAFFSLIRYLLASDGSSMLSSQDFFEALSRYSGGDMSFARDEFFRQTQ